MKAFKFIVREWTVIPSSPSHSVSGCGALVFAESVEEAKSLLHQRNIENGSLPWEEAAHVTEIDPSRAQVALLFEV